MRPDRPAKRAVAASLGLFALVAVLSLVYASRSPASENLAVITLVNLLVVLSLQLFTGNTGVLSFGHPVFAALGAYTTALLTTPALIKAVSVPNVPFGFATVESPVFLAMGIAIVVATAFGALVGIAVARLSGLGAAILTLALLVVVHQVLTNWEQLTGGARAFFGIPEKTSLTLALAAALLGMTAARLYKDSRWGLRAQAVREDELAASALGVSVARTRYGAWVASGALGGMGGVLLAHYLGALTPNDFYFEYTFAIVAFLILGGMQSVAGAVLGTLLVTAVLEVARDLGDGSAVLGVDLPEVHGLSTLVLGAIIVGVMVRRPDGLFGDKELDDLLPRRRRPTTAAAPPTAEAVAPREPAALAAHRLTKRFAGVAALEEVSLDIAPGETVGLIGANGAGKTTLLNLLSGNLAPTEGEIEFARRPIHGRPPAELARRGIARTFQNLRLFEHLSARDNVEVAVDMAARHRPGRPRRSTSDLLAHFGLAELADRRALALAQGDRRRLEMARAVGLAPDLLLLDEPTAGMSATESADVLERIAAVRDELGCSVLVVDHNVPFIMRLCERVYVLDSGRLIADGTPAEIQQDEGVIATYLGSPHRARRTVMA